MAKSGGGVQIEKYCKDTQLIDFKRLTYTHADDSRTLVGSTGYFDGIRLQVRACDVQEALEILDLPDEDELLEGATETNGSAAQAEIRATEGQLCPLCGNQQPGWPQRLRAFFGGVMATSTSPQQQACSACGTVREY